VWTVSLELIDVKGTGCIAETMRSQIAVPRPYSVTVASGGMVTIASSSPTFACSFSPSMDDSGFTTFGKGGYYTCEPFAVPFRCNDGSEHNISTFGQNISGRVTGGEIEGRWSVDWLDVIGWEDGAVVEARYRGRK